MYKLPRGTRDFKPTDMQKYRYVHQHLSETFERYHYQEIRTPTFEHLDLFTAKSGDNIKDELYAFTDKGGRHLALRPELTAPVIRFYIDQLQMEPKPLKVYYIGNCFRYDRPQKGRYREFWQAGCELIGPNTPEAYAELIALAYTQLHTLGLKNITLNIGNLTLIHTLFTNLELTTEQQHYLLPLIDKSLTDELTNALHSYNKTPTQIQDFTTLLETTKPTDLTPHVTNNDTATHQLTLTTQILDLLKNNHNLPNPQFKLSIVRGLEYYQGMVFEIEAPILGAEKQLCGGGAYTLIPLFGGKDVPTAGFAIGIDRTILALDTEKYSFTTPTPEIYIIPIDETVIPHCISLATTLRSHGFITDIDLLRRGMNKALKYANNKNFQYILIMGPDELKQHAVSLKNMTTGEQKLIPTNKLIETLS